MMLECISEDVLCHVSLASFHFSGLKSCSEKAVSMAFSLRMKGKENETGSPALTKPWGSDIMSRESPHRLLLSLSCHMLTELLLCAQPHLHCPVCWHWPRARLKEGGLWASLFQGKEI